MQAAPVMIIATVCDPTTLHGVAGLLARIQVEYDSCVLKILTVQTPRARATSSAQQALLDRCRLAIHKLGVRLEVSYGTGSSDALKKFFSRNSLNAFFHEDVDAGWLRRTLAVACESDRPIAVRRTAQFEKMLGSSLSLVSVENHSLQSLAAGQLPAITLNSVHQSRWLSAVAAVRRCFSGRCD